MPSTLVRLKALDYIVVQGAEDPGTIVVPANDDDYAYAYVSCDSISRLPHLERLSVHELRSDYSVLAARTQLAAIHCERLFLTEVVTYTVPLIHVTELEFIDLVRGSMDTALRMFPRLVRLNCRACRLADAEPASIAALLPHLRDLWICSGANVDLSSSPFQCISAL